MISIGWFDAFRSNGDPSWFDFNRTPVVVDLQILFLSMLFILPLIAYIIILPGVRHQRVVTTIIFLISIFVGSSILISMYYPCWHCGSARIYSQYRAFTNERINAVLGVRIGLQHVNITFESAYQLNTDAGKPNLGRLEYNERYEFVEADSMDREFGNSLRRGLPYPIITVIENLSASRDGYSWGPQYRLSGYYTHFVLRVAFILWIIKMFILCLTPHYFYKLLMAVGVLVLTSDLIYMVFAPKDLQIPFSSPDGALAIIDLRLSLCFYVTVISGIINIILSGTLFYLKYKSLYILQTFLSTSPNEYCTNYKRKSFEVDQIIMSSRSVDSSSFVRRF